MNIVLWVIAGLLSLMFLVAGVMKLARSKQDLAASGMTWTEDFPERTVRLIGVLEVLAAAGLILPPATGIAPVLAPLAAAGVVLLMCGAAVVHLRRKERAQIAVNVVAGLLAALVAWGRFGPYAF
ncbi:hypothetical protein GCM10010106_02310 [Thermopolyspora flexuosa]|uniref:DoxX-like protein n=1 Tax=Thermopolyspora flexuosa TaxID=103836 RepID=A0A543IY77_9ACTN|nr:DoxX family protein [Thermopolyspora flexuosa]TQM75529.1 DoxX-like protein [Thermopolyspora flexuosa]GGM60111.1 hypothetical protein GCM10010106_02310 [Thermopolyspora flexuosa]